METVYDFSFMNIDGTGFPYVVHIANPSSKILSNFIIFKSFMLLNPKLFKKTSFLKILLLLLNFECYIRKGEVTLQKSIFCGL